MSGKPAARLNDPTACPIPGHGSNPISAGSPDVLFDGLPAARQGDPTACGSTLASAVIPTVLINGQPATTIGTLGSHGNAVTAGSGTILIGNLHSPAPISAPAPLELSAAAVLATSATSAHVSSSPSSEARAWHEQADDWAPLGLEEEDEEEELEENQPQEQRITLRLGVFFDGTGNNQSNSQAAAGCYAVNMGMDDALAEDFRQHCAAFGYDGKGATPDNSYGNDVSNIARLYQLYPDQAEEQLAPDADTAYLAVYLEGIGTQSGADDLLYSQITGQGASGVLGRVKQMPAQALKQLRELVRANPNIRIERLEIDLFGFSRGAAAARHCANDLLKGANSLLAQALPANSPYFARGFAWHPKKDFALNFIGLFDSVAAIIEPLRGDLSPYNARHHGLELGLATDCARQVVQLVAEHEYRLNFPLTCTHNDIRLPGAHSDLGGGYLPMAREKLFLSRPDHSRVSRHSHDQQTPAYLRTQDYLAREQARWAPYAQQLDIRLWSKPLPYRPGRDLQPEKQVYAAVSSEREVRGELSLVYLRVMRELAVRAGVPFIPIPDTAALRLPGELETIATRLQAYALGESATALSAEELALLQRRYIHLSANWNAAKGKHESDLTILFANRPAPDYRRVELSNA